ncbi:hypothetical protein [Holdemania massiliensis]|uniref:hypothetical protein n=1 Tax=Holdemania massiliensis TaxID=1468449 RepID=UPI001F06D330|nr:hypothetical protein [Holdemania massiliensis]MCH1939512.1 hypothetical protein [Holdemania massiliensis]
MKIIEKLAVFELKKILKDSKLILLILILLAVNVFSLYYSDVKEYKFPSLYYQLYTDEYKECADNSDEERISTIQRKIDSLYDKKELNKEDAVHLQVLTQIKNDLMRINQYHTSVEEVINNSILMNSVSIFSEKSSISKKNVEKTLQDYEKLLEVQPVNRSHLAYEKFFSNHYTDMFLVIAVILVCFPLIIREKNSSLIMNLKSYFFGGTHTIIAKLTALSIAAVFLTGVFYLSNAVYYQIMIGFVNGNDPVQSISSMMSAEFLLSCNMTMVYHLFAKISLILPIALMMFLLFNLFQDYLFSFSIAFVFIICEGILYFIISYQSSWALFKYMNLFSFFNSAKILYEYNNVPILNCLLSYNHLYFLVSLFLIVSLILISVFVFNHSFEFKTKLRVKKRHKMLYTNHTHILIHEINKLFFHHKLIYGFLAFGIFLIYSCTYVNFTKTQTDKIFDQYLLKLHGEYTAEKQMIVENERNMINEAIAELDYIEDQFYNNKIDYSDYYIQKNRLSKILDNNSALSMIENQVNENIENPFILDSKGYSYLLDLEAKDDIMNGNLRDCFIVMIIVIFCSCNLFSENSYKLAQYYEAVNCIKPKERCVKVFMLFALSCILALSLFSKKMYLANNNFILTDIHASVGNIPELLLLFPESMTLAKALIIQWLSRLLAVFAVSLMSSLFTLVIKTKYMSIIVSFFTIFIPPLMVLCQFSPFRLFSFSRFFTGAISFSDPISMILLVITTIILVFIVMIFPSSHKSKVLRGI